MNEELIEKGNAQEEAGASMVEYALLVALIAIIAIAALTFLGQRVSNSFSASGSALNVAT